MESGYVGELVRTQERASTIPSPEFSRRILIGPTNPGVLNPNTKNLPLPEEKDLGSLGDRDYSLFNTKSDGERKEFWENRPENIHDERMEAWRQQTRELFRKNANFFQNTENGRHWKEVYAQYGLTADNITDAELNNFYGTFLSKQLQGDEKIKKFVTHTLSSDRYKDTDGQIAIEKIEKDLKAIEYLAHFFGDNSSQVVSRLLHAEAQLKVKPEKILTDDKRQSEKEIELLEFLSGITYLDYGYGISSGLYANGGNEVLTRASEKQKKQFEQNRSQTLKENPSAKLDPQKEIQEYFKRQSPEYMQEVATLAEKIPPMNPETKAVICIPVAGHQEGSNIFNTLENYTHQTASNKDYEILLFINYPEKDREGNTLNATKTLEEIKRFEEQYPDAPVRTVVKALPIEEAKVGTARKYLSDIALYRHQERGSAEDIILISNDADLKGVAPEYIENFIKKFYEHPEVDGFLGQLDWDAEDYAKYPLVHLGTRLFQYLNTIGRNRSDNIVSSGANFAYKGSIYAAIGGYLKDFSKGEDVALGQAIVEGRKNKKSIGYASGRVSRLYTSARRGIVAVKKGLSPIEQWDDEFSAFDDEVRKMQQELGENIDYDNSSHVANLQEGLEKVIDRTLSLYEKGENLEYGKNAHLYRLALQKLGIHYIATNDGIHITNIKEITENLKRYREVAVLQRDIKSGRATPEMQQQLSLLLSQQENNKLNKQLSEDETRRLRDELVSEELKSLDFQQVILPDLPQPKYSIGSLKQSRNWTQEGPYVICLDKPLESGQMGTIVAGYDTRTDEVVAIKTVRKEDQAFIAKANDFPKDIRDIEDAIKERTQSSILGVYKDKITLDKEILKITPIASEDLLSYLTNHGPLSTEAALQVAITLAQSVRELHKNNIVHLDIAPTNILLTTSGIRLIDFDAGSMKNGHSYKRGFIGGNRRYTPPEMFVSNPRITESIDTYETTILLYEMLTGKTPFNIPNDANLPGVRSMYLEMHQKGAFEIPKELPEEIKNILKKGIQPIPTDRYQNTNELLLDLIYAYKSLGRPAN